MEELQARGDLYTRQLIKEKRRIESLQTQLNYVHSKIATTRDSNKEKAISLMNKYTITKNDAYHRVDGLNPSRLAENNQKKIVKTLESRLGKALVRRNQLENENDVIKSKIDKLRRKVHNDIKNKESMDKEMLDIQEDMDEIMKRSAAVANERERLLERRHQVLHQDNEKQEIFAQEMFVLCKQISDQSKALEESIAKAADHVTAKLNNVANGRGQGSSSIDNDTAKNSKDDIHKLRNKLDIIEANCSATQKTLQENQWKIQHFEETFNALKEVSGLSSTEDIINTFVKNEDECFSMFNYIQALNQDCDKTIEQATKLRQDIDTYRNEQMETEKARSTTMNVYKGTLQEVQHEREKLYATAIEGRRTIETIARRVTALYFKLKCHELDQNKLTSKKSVLPPQLQTDRKLTTIGGGEVSERNILNLMELIETRSIQIVDAYLKQLSTSKRSRRPSLILSPQMFERANFSRPLNEESDEEDESSEESDEESESSDDDESIGELERPVSVRDIRLEAKKANTKQQSRPNTADLSEKEDKSQKLPRHTVF